MRLREIAVAVDGAAEGCIGVAVLLFARVNQAFLIDDAGLLCLIRQQTEQRFVGRDRRFDVVLRGGELGLAG